MTALGRVNSICPAAGSAPTRWTAPRRGLLGPRVNIKVLIDSLVSAGTAKTDERGCARIGDRRGSATGAFADSRIRTT